MHPVSKPNAIAKNPSFRFGPVQLLVQAARCQLFAAHQAAYRALKADDCSAARDGGRIWACAEATSRECRILVRQKGNGDDADMWRLLRKCMGIRAPKTYAAGNVHSLFGGV